MYGCQQVLLKPDSELAGILEFICSEANKLTNCGLYYARQLWFKRRWIIGKYDLEKEYKIHKDFQALPSQAAQQVLRSVSESFKSFRELTKAFAEGKSRALGIDPGVNNWVTCVFNIGTRFIVDGRKLKSLNQFYNKRVAKLQKGKPHGFWHEQLASYTEKRNRQMRDAVNKAARYIINADGNGAANVLRKVEIQLRLNLAKVCRASLTAPSRLFIWNSKKTLLHGVSTRGEVSF